MSAIATRQTIATSLVREVRIVARNGHRFAFWRWRGTRSTYWKGLSITAAARAIRDGCGTFGGYSGPVIEHGHDTNGEAA